MLGTVVCYEGPLVNARKALTYLLCTSRYILSNKEHMQ
jgi:hypothetical protein